MDYSEYIQNILQNDALGKRSVRAQLSNGPVKNVNLMPKENSRVHHTAMFHKVHSHLQTPIFRRGEAFTLTIEFKEPFQLADKSLRLDFDTGGEPTPDNGTLVHLEVSHSTEFPAGTGNWAVRMKSNAGKTITLQVRPAAQCPVSVWRLTVVIQPGNQAFKVPQHFYVLFNPWCKDDSVYLEDDKQRKEYVLNQSGSIFTGTASEIGWRDWNYNQFHPVTLPAALYGLEEIEHIDTSQFGDPVVVTRSLSYASGCIFLFGQWDGKYGDGVEPNKWWNSIDVLNTYMKNPTAQVKYGQCWVFAGITCSMVRALGIPCRVVTNYASAHDTNKNLIVEELFNSSANMKLAGDDSVWNFHVWNDAWMTRPDLPDGYGGWQAFDGCPQEFSDTGRYECGPASVVAIKNGEIGLRYDTLFIYSEINADWKVFIQDIFGSIRLHQMRNDATGKILLTQGPGENGGQREDVTDLYRLKEGTSEERNAFLKVLQAIGGDVASATSPMSGPTNSIFFELSPVNSVIIGQPVTIVANAEHRGYEKRTVEFSMWADSIQYNGLLKEHINLEYSGSSHGTRHTRTVTMAPGQKEMVIFCIYPESYLYSLTPMGHIRIYATAKIIEDPNDPWLASDNVIILKPPMQVEVPKTLQLGMQCDATLKFTNPLPIELKNCEFHVEANCNSEALNSKFRNISANEEVVYNVNFIPEHSGPCNILSAFNSDVLQDVLGAETATVV